MQYNLVIFFWKHEILEKYNYDFKESKKDEEELPFDKDTEFFYLPNPEDEELPFD